MGRLAIHSEEKILDAARDLVLEGGARSATLNAIAAASGAPKGSIYHRYASLNDLLARMWVRAVRRSQGAFIEALEKPDAMQAAVAAALSLHDFARRERADARLLASLRRQDLIESADSPQLRRELRALNRPLEAALAKLARRLFGQLSARSLEATVCAVVDIPIGATRRHLIAGSPLPSALGGQIEAAVRAALLEAGAGRHSAADGGAPMSSRHMSGN
jgi:AcrR family transcriptional regulator